MTRKLMNVLDDVDDGGPYNVKEYPQREIYAFGRYIKCQILNWDDGPPPPFLICNPLDTAHREEFLATRGMGTWMHVDLRRALWLIANSKDHAISSGWREAPEPGYCTCGRHASDQCDFCKRHADGVSFTSGVGK